MTAAVSIPGPADTEGPEAASVVIPLYNKAQFVRRCLESIATQTVPPKAVIVVDDGSTDGGADVVAAFGGPPITLIRQKNSGVSVARNRGMEAAATDLVAFLDADDEWKPEFLATVLALQRRFPDAGMWTTSYERVGADGTAVPARLKGVPTDQDGGLIPDFFAVPQGVAAWTGAILGRRSIFLGAGGFRAGLALGQDIDLWVRVALQYPIAFHPSPMARYHVEPGLHHSTQRGRHAGETPIVQTIRHALKTGEFRHTTRRSLEKYLAHHLFMIARHCFRAGERDTGFAMLAQTASIPGYFWKRLRRRLFARLGRY